MIIPVIRHSPYEDLGFLYEIFLGKRLDWRYFHFATDTCPGTLPDSASGLVVLGGSQSVNDPLLYLRREMEWIEEGLHRKIPILGICLGAQLLARALGATVYRNATPEIGWFPVTTTSEAVGDPLLGDFGIETVFHWHFDTFALPAGARRLAYSDACCIQAFRYGDHAWGLQFHLEATPEIIDRWCREDAACGETRELREAVDPWHRTEDMRRLAAGVFGGWTAQVAEHVTR